MHIYICICIHISWFFCTVHIRPSNGFPGGGAHLPDSTIASRKIHCDGSREWGWLKTVVWRGDQGIAMHLDSNSPPWVYRISIWHPPHNSVTTLGISQISTPHRGAWYLEKDYDLPRYATKMIERMGPLYIYIYIYILYDLYAYQW